MVDEPPEVNRKELREGLERAADDGWPNVGGGVGSTNQAEPHEAQPDRASSQ